MSISDWLKVKSVVAREKRASLKVLSREMSTFGAEYSK